LLADVGGMNLMPLSAGLIIVPCAFWFGFIAPPLFEHPVGALAPIVVALTMCLALGNLLFAWITEPGIIPFISVEEKESNDENTDGETMLRRNTRKKYVVSLNGQTYPMPLFRAKICRETEACVERFDHFCPWVGNVVGIRNHRYFVLFTLFSSAVALEVFVSSIIMGASEDISHLKPHERAIALALASYTAVIMLAVGGLMCYHMDLILNNESTNERLKGVFRVRQNPYNKGPLQNCYDFWCVPTRQSYVSNENKDDDVPLPLLPHEEP